MRIAFLHNEFTEDPAYDPSVVVPPGMPVAEALERLGHDVTRIACTLDLAAVRERLREAGPEVVFNHVESLGGSDQLSVAVALLLEALGLPFTGCGSEALVGTTGKLASKARLHESGLPTPPWHEGRPGGARGPAWPGGPAGARHIVKAVYEHASFQMSDASVVKCAGEDALIEAVGAREAASGKRHFAERYVEGREFNVSLLGRVDGDGADVLPPAEIRFVGFPDGRPRIVGHRAKWDERSFEYRATPRSFEHGAGDRDLLASLGRLATAAWRTFGLRGYARVDFRVDGRGAPWILEINANPCLAPDAGFAAALGQAGLEYDAAMQRLLDAALAGAPGAAVATP